MVTQISEGITPPKPTSYVLGLPLHRLENYSQWIVQQVTQRQGGHVVTLNAEMAMQADQDPALADVIRAAELVVPDGAGVVLYMLLRGQKIRRCPGIELAESLIQSAATTMPAPSLFFYGGKPGVAETAVQQWQTQYPELAIAGIQHGYLPPEDEATFCQTLKTANPAIIFVGLGVPRQEFWITQHRHLCPDAVWVGVGGSFDIWAGVKDRAPQWLRNNSLEWTYRLYQEPWRWRRMLALPKFAWRALWGR
ncbi:MAG: WecB/TagA/CpsF family glycosyltransferase [Cyanothece sp. SIO2G6]|nr:WecB/TagA/CpsF family glycosyltransferase [Cyanothece sp. SIO2G6]